MADSMIIGVKNSSFSHHVIFFIITPPNTQFIRY